MPPSVTKPLPNVTAAGIGVPTMQEEIQRLAREMANEMVGSLEIYEVIAPVGDPTHPCWDAIVEGRVVRKYNPSIAAQEGTGTFNIEVPAHEVYNQETKKRVTKVEAQVVPMFSGIARTRDQHVAQWIADNFGYRIKRVDSGAPITVE